MTAPFHEFNYKVLLEHPIQTQAWIAKRDSDWRLIVFPGTPARRYLFDQMLKKAPEDLEVVVLARPGYGKGLGGRIHDRPYLQFEDQIAAALPHMNDGKKIIALGVSYGGELALKALVDHPDKVKGAVTVAALITEPRGWVHPFLKLGGFPLVRSLVPRSLHYSRAEIAGRRRQIGPLFESLKEVTAPVTILHGDVDHLVSMKDAHALKRYFRPEADVEFRHVRGGTHFLEMQYPNLMFDMVRGVIRRAEAASAVGGVNVS